MTDDVSAACPICGGAGRGCRIMGDGCAQCYAPPPADPAPWELSCIIDGGPAIYRPRPAEPAVEVAPGELAADPGGGGGPAAEEVPAGAETKKAKRSQADWLVDLAMEVFRFARSLDGEAFAVPRGGPNVALLFRGSRSALRARLAREYRRRTGKTPGAAALADALVALEGETADVRAEPVYLRVARAGESIILDLGDETGRAAAVTASGWRIVDVSPVLFRRTAATGTLPVPDHGGDLDNLRSLLNVAGADWPMLTGWLVAALVPDVPHPILALGGEHGAGKTSAARVLVGLIDPSPAPTRSEPKDVEGWAIAASGSWAVCIDNLSRVAPWFSDCLCKSVTGDALIRRALYTDAELAILSFRRVVVLTSIDPGGLRGDLADRLLRIDLRPIPAEARQTETELDARYQQLRPGLLGALLDALSRTLRELPAVTLAGLPRMADFARILAAFDAANGTDALPRYLSMTGRLGREVVEDDPVGQAILGLGSWAGAPADLYARLTPERPPRGWPAGPRSLSAVLRRLAPNLRALGVEVSFGRSGGARRVEISRDFASHGGFASPGAAAGPETRFSRAATVPQSAATAPDPSGRCVTRAAAEKPHSEAVGADFGGRSGGRGANDARFPILSEPDCDRRPWPGAHPPGGDGPDGESVPESVLSSYPEART